MARPLRLRAELLPARRHLPGPTARAPVPRPAARPTTHARRRRLSVTQPACLSLARAPAALVGGGTARPAARNRLGPRNPNRTRRAAGPAPARWAPRAPGGGAGPAGGRPRAQFPSAQADCLHDPSQIRAIAFAACASVSLPLHSWARPKAHLGCAPPAAHGTRQRHRPAAQGPGTAAARRPRQPRAPRRAPLRAALSTAEPRLLPFSISPHAIVVARPSLRQPCLPQRRVAPVARRAGGACGRRFQQHLQKARSRRDAVSPAAATSRARPRRSRGDPLRPRPAALLSARTRSA